MILERLSMKLSDLPKPMANEYINFYKDKGSVEEYISYLQATNVGLVERQIVSDVNKLLGSSIIEEVEITGTPRSPRITVRVSRAYEKNEYYIGAPSDPTLLSTGKYLVRCSLQDTIKLAMSYWYSFCNGWSLLFQRGFYGFSDYKSSFSEHLEHANYFYFSPVIGARRAPYSFVCKDNIDHATSTYFEDLFAGYSLIYDRNADYTEWSSNFKNFELAVYSLDSASGECFKSLVNFFDFVDVEFVS